MKRILGGLLALGVLLALALAATVSRRLEPLAEEAPEVLFAVESGASLGRIAEGLEAAELVRDARAVAWLARFRGLAGSLRAGEYRLSAALSPEEILDQIAAGRVATYEVVVPEGFTAVMIAQRLEEAGLADAAEFEAVTRDPDFAAALSVPSDRLEGYLFPETYTLARGESARAIARAMVEQFQRVWVDLAPAAEARGLEMHEVVTLASIVEKETGAPEERPLIASVFANRLARRMRLESDPTTIYGIPDFDGNLRRRDLENEDNPYNTYRIPALPPGPIASPGRAALAAVVEPADSEYLFFVSRNDGTHVFTKSYSEHVRAVDRYQRRRRSR
jgi:UPF0755 protein